ncbi:MAG: oxidoreductase [Aeromicrobium sp.]|uniref:oxidoreductase n=1 Tax=Aeromicrobium sp. TaxID=1871063 RepID=UPI0039E4EF80
MSRWSTTDIGDQTGRRFLVTGVTGGLGTQIAGELARHGASLIVTARDAAKAEATLERVRRLAPEADIRLVDLDLADLASVERAAEAVHGLTDRIDVLVNNAGIMVPPLRHTADGFELQIGTNHLGHFALTARLWPLLADAPGARVVTVSSLAHTAARRVDLRSLTPEGAPRRYRRWPVYAESKLANLQFAQELHRRAGAAGLDVASVAAHPGFAATELTKTGWGLGGLAPVGFVMHQGTKVIAQSAHAGAMPILMAATDPALTGGEYLGPQGFRGLRGRPGPSPMTRAARDADLGAALWAASESAAGLSFPVTSAG